MHSGIAVLLHFFKKGTGDKVCSDLSGMKISLPFSPYCVYCVYDTSMSKLRNTQHTTQGRCKNVCMINLNIR